MAEPWPEMNPAQPSSAQVHRCRHCPKNIMLRAGYWIDQDGIMYCQKRRRDSVTGKLQDPILHEPMPAVS
jgi:hypothetical protein